MRHLIYRYLFFIIITFLPVVVYSQLPDDFTTQEEIQPSAPQKDIKPEIKLWYLSGDGAFQDSTRLDTALRDYHLYHPVYKNSITATYLGNYGLPYLNNNFFERKSNIDFFFLRTREAYLLTPSKIKYYNTRTPYTVLDYSQSENKNRKSETRFNVLHTQNVNPYLNFTFRYDQARSDGQYNYQDTKNSVVSLYSNYNKDALKIHAGFIANSIQNSENGGIIEEDSISITDKETEYLKVNLNSTRSKFTNAYFFATGEYRFGKYIKSDTIPVPEPDRDEDSSPATKPDVFRPIVGLIYSVEYQRHYKQFTDEEDTTNTFFPNTYFGNDYIKDSIRFNKISNIFQIKQYENAARKTSFGKRAFIGQELVKITYPGPYSEIYNHAQTKKYSNVYVGGGIFRETGNFWTWNAEGKFYILGRNIGQTEISGVISKPFHFLNDSSASLTIRGSIQNLVPDYFQDRYYSNHSIWDNDLRMEQSMVAKGSFEMPKYNLKVGANYALINNYIFNDTLGTPDQTNKQLLVVSAYIDKDFSLRNLHLRTRLLYQKASNRELIHLPEFSAFVSAYYQFIVSKVLYTQLGVDTRYNTLYYSDAYDPSTGLFYLQNEKKTGNFPYIDAYATLRLKRTRFFFKMMNIGTSFLNGEYYTTPHYPMNRMTFRLGVAWSFYD